MVLTIIIVEEFHRLDAIKLNEVASNLPGFLNVLPITGPNLDNKESILNSL